MITVIRARNMRFDYSKLTNPIEIFEMKSVTDEGMAQKPKPVTFLECFAHLETVSLKDYQTSVQMGTENEIKAFVRNYPGITNKMMIKDLVTEKEYKINHVLLDYRNSGFSVLVAKEVNL